VRGSDENCIRGTGDIVLSGGDDHLVKMFDLRTYREIHAFGGHRALVGDVCADESKIISCANDGAIKIWDMESKKCIDEINTKPNLWVWCVQFDDEKIVSGNTRGETCLHFLQGSPLEDPSKAKKRSGKCLIQ